MKEFKVIDADAYSTYGSLAKLLTELSKDGWEVVCTLGNYNHTLLLARTVLPKATYYGKPIEKEIPPDATSASDDHST